MKFSRCSIHCNLNFLRMRVFEYSTKALGNQVIDQILESSNTQKNVIYSVFNLLIQQRLAI